jgi:hypothetical protein
MAGAGRAGVCRDVKTEKFLQVLKELDPVNGNQERAAFLSFLKHRTVKVPFCSLLPVTTLTEIGILRSVWCSLNARGADVDTDHMRGTDGQTVAFEEQCLAVLGSYLRFEAEMKATDPEFNGWLDRVLAVPGVDSSTLTRVHGYLIAEGLIRFEFGGRSKGLQYQLSPPGRDAISRRSLIPPEESRSSEGDSADFVSQAA